MTRLAHVVAHEPVRVWLYGIATAVAGLLILTGRLELDEATAWLGIAAAVVSVPVATETLRAQVSPVGRHVRRHDG